MTDRPLDLIIIGAGLYGICAADTYLQLHPAADIVVLDGDSSPGGAWSRSRQYPEFWSQAGIRMSGYPDVPFEIPEHAEVYHDLYEAKHLTKYLEDYLETRSYQGRHLHDRFLFDCWVSKVQKKDNIWFILAQLHGREVTYTANKIIVATGLTSEPLIPTLSGKDAFQGAILHQKDFGRSQVFTPSESNVEKHSQVTVLGGSKSASDIVYAAAKDSTHPRKVNWIIRTSGSGPIVLVDAKGFGKYRTATELGSTRAIASLSAANPYLPETLFSSFLHKTWVGEWLLERLWGLNSNKAIAVANYEAREGALPGFEKLKPEGQVRWRSGPMGILQREDFWDVVAKNVRVFRGEVERLVDGRVVLEDGTEVETDILLCATGWKQQYPFFEPKMAAQLGLPVALEHANLVEELRQNWSVADQEADRRVLDRWPYLASVPKSKTPAIGTTPYRLYNMTVAPNDSSITFLGLQAVPNSYHTSVVQSLYAIAVLDGAVHLPSMEEMNRSIAFINQWCTRRYPVHGWMGNVLDYEMVSFTDHLLEQLKLDSHRKMKNWWADATDPCLASDYAGLVDEYRRVHM